MLALGKWADSLGELLGDCMSRLTGVLRGALASLPVWLAAISAFFASLSALSVYQGEKYRLEFEKLKLTYEVMHRSAEFARQSETAVPCIEAFALLDDAAIGTVLAYQGGSIPSDRAEVLKCLALEGKDIAEERLDIPENNNLRRQTLAQFDQLNSILIPYRYDAGVRPVICESAWALLDRSVYGDFVGRLIRLGWIDARTRFTNIFYFVKEMERVKTCPAYEPPRLERNRVLEVLERIVR